MTIPAGYDAWKLGGDPSSLPVEITCRDCGHEFAGVLECEYGGATLQPEECPACGSDELDHAAAEPPDPPDA
jgi:hypothetical protein